MNSQQVIAALRTRFAPPEYAFFTEVGDSTGGRSRSADGLAMSLWPSRGLSITGFEVKVSRSDWQSELRNPGKAETICRFCDYWYVVVPEAKIVAPGELPATWGLIVVGASKLTFAKEAPKLEPEELGRRFLASVCRAASKSAAGEDELRAAYLRGVAESSAKAQKDAEQSFKYQLDHARSNEKHLQEVIETFEKQAGFSIRRWNGHNIGKAVAALERHKDHALRESLVTQRHHLANLLKDYDTVLEATEVAPAESEVAA